jgi:hypothetical protein
MAAPGTPNAQVTPSRSSTRTAASTARILAIASSLVKCFPVYLPGVAGNCEERAADITYSDSENDA